MQQSGNDEIKTMIFVLSMGCAFVYVAVVLAALAAALIAGFITLCLTILCLCAWFKEITIFGHILAPAEARAFIRRGLAGAILCLVFLIFCALVLNLRVTDNALLYAALFGYVAGSSGFEFIKAWNEDDASQGQEILPPQIEPPSAPPARGLASPDAKPFRFATWDDEDARR